MKKRALRKEFIMEIRKSLPRFLSILFIVALGTAFYSGIQSSSPDMRYSGDAYFDAKELSDIQVTGTMGVTGDDVEALQNLKDIETAEGVCLKDVLTGEEGQRKVLRILSIPEKSNLVTVEEGEYPTKEDECLMDVQYAEHNGYQIGDTSRDFAAARSIFRSAAAAPMSETVRLQDLSMCRRKHLRPITICRFI